MPNILEKVRVMTVCVGGFHQGGAGVVLRSVHIFGVGGIQHQQHMGAAGRRAGGRFRWTE